VTVACYKIMALILRFVLPQQFSRPVRFTIQVLSLALVPALLLLAVVANVSFLGNGGDDCLGYTVLANKRLT